MAKFSRELIQTFVGLGAAVAKKNFSRRDEIHDGLREPSLRFVIIKIRDMHQLARLLDERLGDGRMRVAKGRHRDAAAEVEITFARDVKNVTA